MSLFDQFNETILYKKDSELELQIDALRKINNEYPNNEKISQKLRICELGLKGEKEIEFELKNAKILSDIKLKLHGKEIIRIINDY